MASYSYLLHWFLLASLLAYLRRGEVIDTEAHPADARLFSSTAIVVQP